MKKFLITVLVIVLLILIGDICYIEFFKDNNIEENDEQINTVTLVSLLDESEFLTEEDKLDPTLPYVYEIAPVYEIEMVEGVEERKYTGEFAYEGNNLGEYKVPFINLKGDDNERANKWMKLASILVNTTKGSSNEKADETTLSYSYVTTKDNVMSFKFEGQLDGLEIAYGVNLYLKDKTVICTEKWLEDSLGLDGYKEVLKRLMHQINIEQNKEEKDLENQVMGFFVYNSGLDQVYDDVFNTILNKVDDFDQYCVKTPVYENNIYQGYILKTFPFIKDDGSIDIEKFESFTEIYEINCYLKHWYDENDNMIVACAHKKDEDVNYKIAYIIK
ncbi:MAG: hypothetical protein MJ245_01955 [Clostridia bacterium]|nr:hypothetical protein [Clostridia bacterium]